MRRGLGLTAGALMLAMSGASMAHAQDAGPVTPPELRDFRLDPPPLRETPSGPEVRAPLPQQDTQDDAPPALPPTTQSIPPPVIRAPSPVAAQPAPASRAPSVDVTPNVAAPPDADVSMPAAPQSADAAPAESGDRPETDTPVPVESDGIGIAQIAALAALLLAIISAALWMRRRRRTAALPVKKQTMRQSRKPVSSRPAVPYTPSPAPIMPQVASLTRNISMTFTPEHAVVSFSSLTIKGQLHIANLNEAAADDLVLNAALLSASNEQQAAIDNFFAHPAQDASMPVGSIEPEQTIIIPLERGIALNQMQTFSLQAKTLLAPILVAKLVHMSSDGGPQEVARLVCMIGRESNPPQLKMGPLRLDQGPRSFDRLGQRALVS